MKHNVVEWWWETDLRLRQEKMALKTLSELWHSKKYISDKGTDHSYIDNYYSQELTPKRHDVLNFVEIGICWGGSLLMWKDWFINSTITGIDNKRMGYSGDEYNDIIKIRGDAYSDDIVNNFNDNSIDYLIDDGPHTLESQLTCVQKYFSKISIGGKIIIEDVQDCEKDALEFQKLDVVKNNLCTFEVIDLRHIKNRHDDVLFVLKKI